MPEKIQYRIEDDNSLQDQAGAGGPLLSGEIGQQDDFHSDQNRPKGVRDHHLGSESAGLPGGNPDLGKDEKDFDPEIPMRRGGDG